MPACLAACAAFFAAVVLCAPAFCAATATSAAAASSSAQSASAAALRREDRVLCFGDSITYHGVRGDGYVNVLRQRIAAVFPDATVVGSGIPGNKVRDLLARFDADVVPQRPTLVIVYIGINDVWHGGNGSTPTQYADGLRTLTQRIGALHARAVLCTPTVIGERPAGGNPLDVKLDAYADIVRRVAAETGSGLIDLRRAFADYLATRNPQHLGSGILTQDGVHLGTAGNALVAETMAMAMGLPPILAGSASSAP